ncbi:MAG: flagellar hook-associated protein FlgK [Lachnospiraceae bacterium]|nr:flagellar hook-associated protein FlgK [Clostridium sp.]MDD6179233.1 flagellar hook-associated protein FlgK [Clostridium sp.]MDY4820220.1 flagellar hook-associated protein FlgK [Lachnospiraceae bacterium]
MPLMGSLYIGASGLQSGQNALNTTAHNLTNIDTTGFTRQQTLLSSKRYITISKNPAAVSDQQYGIGVNLSAVRQVRDYFLDQTYRKESGRSTFYEASTDVLGEVENVLGELNGEDFQTSLTNLWTAVQELSKDPSSSVTQGLLVQRSAEFINRANAVYQDLTNYQDNLNKQIKEKVTTINQYGKQIQALNDQIRKIECGGIEHANDLRDTRNQILDELGKLCKMTYSEDSTGNVSVRIEDSDFVRGDLFYEIGLDASDATGFYTPFWIKDAEYTVLADGTKKYNIEGAEVFNLDQTVSSSLDTDIGGLKALLLARGDHRSNYTDINNNYDSISQSIVMNVQAEFDQMIHSVTTRINGILAEVYDPSRGYMCDKDGSPLQLFQKITTDGYEKVTDAGGNVTWKYAEEDPARTDTLYTLGNLQVNANLLREPSMLSFKKADGSADYDTTDKLKAAFTDESYTLNPNVLKKTTFVDYYKDLVSQVANTGSAFRNIYENQQTTVEATYNAREQIVGVSSEEELSNMIRFQNAYNASSRYINVINELLEHIISTLAV